MYLSELPAVSQLQTELRALELEVSRGFCLRSDVKAFVKGLMEREAFFVVVVVVVGLIRLLVSI